MIIYKDIFTNDELISDSFEIKDQGAYLEVAGKFVTLSAGAIDIGGNPSGEGADAEEAVDDQARTVIDIIEFFKLQETTFDKKSYKGYVKDYMKNVKTWLEEHKPDRVESFMKGIQPFIVEVLGNFDEYQFFLGESCNCDAQVVLCRYLEGSTTPTFYFIKDGLKELKC
jgi:hypothetical protein